MGGRRGSQLFSEENLDIKVDKENAVKRKAVNGARKSELEILKRHK